MPTGNEFSDVRLSGDRTFKSSGDKSGNPEELLQQASAGVRAHADLMECYGYCEPTATLGSHPWLRDSLATTEPSEPGNAEPEPGYGVPKRGEV